jgi:hypothetical protein
MPDQHPHHSKALDPILLAEQQTEVRAVGGPHASVEHPAGDRKGHDILGVVQKVQIAFGCSEDRCRVLTQAPQERRDTDKRPGTYCPIGHRRNLH